MANNRMMEDIIEVEAPLSTTSIAINGIFKLDGKLTDIKENYSFNIKKDVLQKKNNELLILHGQVLKNMKNLDIKLSEINETRTRLEYKVEKNKNTAVLVAMIILELVISLSVGAAFASLDGFGSSPAVTFIIAFLITALIFSFMPVIAVIPTKDKNIKKNMDKYFVERLYSYISIVRKTQK